MQNVGDNDGDLSETKLTERQQEILNLIKESPTIHRQANVGDIVSEPTHYRARYFSVEENGNPKA